MIVPKEIAERGDRIETLLVDIKRLLEVIAARQLVQIEIADPHDDDFTDEEVVAVAKTLTKLRTAHE